MTTQSEENVFNKVVDSSNEAILLEQYKLYVESANLTSRLRSQANTFFLTLNTFLIGFLAGLLELSSQTTTSLWIVFAGIAGILLCISWYFILRSYRSLNSGRFAVIHELETQLPARIYAREWELITSRRPKKSKYIRQTYIEQVIPLAFCLLYLALVTSYILSS